MEVDVREKAWHRPVAGHEDEEKSRRKGYEKKGRKIAGML